MSSNTVNNLKRKADLGEWRGHDVELDVEKGTFGSDSAGLSGCNTIAEVKRLIDAQEKRKYQPVKAFIVGTFGGGANAVTILSPAQKRNYMGGESKNRHFWVKNQHGSRTKERGDVLVQDTSQNRAKINEATKLRAVAKELNDKATAIIDALPRLDTLEMEELEPGDD